MSKKIIIIGAGVSGLSAGIFAQKNGYNTIIYEKNAFSGGNLTGWTRKNCYIDNCIHWLNGSKDGNKFNTLWKELGAFEGLEFYQSEDFVVSEYEGERIGLNKNLETTHKNMLLLSPIDKKEIEKFVKCVETIIKLNNAKKLQAIKNLLKMLSIYKKQTIFEVKQKFYHPLLKRLLSDYIPENYSIYALLFAYASFCTGDGKVLKNGSKAMAKNITNKYLSLGGKIEYNSPVTRLNTIGKNVVSIKLQNGEEVFADKFICCVDPKIIFNEFLNKQEMPRTLKMTYNLRKSYPIITSFHIAYKTTANIDIPDNFVFELNSEILIGNTNYTRIMLKKYAYGINFTPDESYVLQVFLLQSDQDYDAWARLNNTEYKKEKERIVKKISEEIVEKFSISKEDMEFLDCWTPLSYTKYFNAYKGSYMSFGITKKIKLSIFPSKIKYKNLYFATQWQRLFGGLPNALLSGKNCIEKNFKTQNK